MTKKHRNGAMIVLGLAVAVGLGTRGAQGAELKLLPTPKSIQLAGGDMPLTEASRIVATDSKLKPLAEILSGEVLLVTGLRLAPVEGEGRPGDIVLKINPALRADADIWT
ncbi:MAG: hypothetical protein NT031_00240, partial [Planctomycetota bacterium]|nr:hypothetical protein [Planctomycetota bacterium]